MTSVSLDFFSMRTVHPESHSDVSNINDNLYFWIYQLLPLAIFRGSKIFEGSYFCFTKMCRKQSGTRNSQKEGSHFKTSNAVSLDDDHHRHKILGGKGHIFFIFQSWTHFSKYMKFINAAVHLLEMKVLCYIWSHTGDLCTN